MYGREWCNSATNLDHVTGRDVKVCCWLKEKRTKERNLKILLNMFPKHCVEVLVEL